MDLFFVFVFNVTWLFWLFIFMCSPFYIYLITIWRFCGFQRNILWRKWMLLKTRREYNHEIIDKCKWVLSMLKCTVLHCKYRLYTYIWTWWRFRLTRKSCLSFVRSVILRANKRRQPPYQSLIDGFQRFQICLSFLHQFHQFLSFLRQFLQFLSFLHQFLQFLSFLHQFHQFVSFLHQFLQFLSFLHQFLQFLSFLHPFLQFLSFWIIGWIVWII